ncbi:DUF3304 domain-containing protein [Kushneria aurantia]|uniref:DUF3304 domain-containing protein n=1 Tax=Kushneria aurantia TaxID=504092 RepID=A0ABV6G775_9GAMM|nr:DUF3304 domain-containing protein [Kushneria aurantia]
MRHYLQRGLLLLWLLSLTACGDDRVDLNVTGVDYAGQGIRYYYVVDPSDNSNRGGGESIGPYSAGGIMCCYSVPQKWHEGLSVDVVVSYPLEGDTTDERSASLARREAEGKLNETIHVEIPEYETPAEGTLWVQFLPDKQARVVVSNLSPDHEDFPGEVKGWPVPSDEYRTKLIDRELRSVKQRLERNRRNLNELEETPEETLKKFWGSFERTRTRSLEQYSGYEDPRFQKMVKSYLEKYIKDDQKRIDDLEEASSLSDFPRRA